MNADKYIEKLKKSQKYIDLTSGKLDLLGVKYLNGCSKKGLEIESGVYQRNNDCVETFAKWDDIGEIAQYSKISDTQWKHYLFVNAYIIHYYNKNAEFDENLWLYIYKEIITKFKYCIDKTEQLEWALKLEAGCEKISHNEISDDDWSGAIWKYWKQYKKKPKSNRRLKLVFDKWIFDDKAYIGITNGLMRQRKAEKFYLEKWFKEIFPTCNTKEEVIEKMSCKIGSQWSEASYKKYKAKLFPNINKKYSKDNTDRIKRIEEARQMYGTKWYKYVDNKDYKWWTRYNKQ